RVSELDICLFLEAGKKRLSNTLFDQYFEQEHKPETYYFSVYKEDLPFSECSYFLYNNRYKDRLLIPEKKEVDFFFLIPHSAAMQPEEWQDQFSKIKEIQ